MSRSGRRIFRIVLNKRERERERERTMEKREEPRSGNLFAMIRIFVEVQFELNVVGIGCAIVP